MKRLNLFNKFIMCACILPLSAVACGCDKKVPLNEINDNFRNIYQIMPISFADSNGDGYGDIRGIIDKLDYIKDMNYTGIWLTPIHKSNSYHKYDVMNYKSIDPTFGTLEDYDELVNKCHEKGMTILLDLVINHTSSANEWFLKACDAHNRNRPDDQYYNYYNFVRGVPSTGWHSVPGSNTWIYEGSFNSGMPDLNLESIIENDQCYLAKDLEDVMKFWLVDHNIDGFRLDAVNEYCNKNTTNNKAVLTWINNTAKRLKPSCYIVGEGDWTANSAQNKEYQASGIDSFFNFANANADGNIGSSLKRQNFSRYFGSFASNKEVAQQGMPAVFIANHDTGRSVGAVAGRSSSNNAKFGLGLLELMPGVTYTYYGDEIGMAVPSNATNNDPNKRLPMDWGDNYVCKDPSGTISYNHDDAYPYENVKEQMKDKKSILNYVKRANRLRREFPQLARGDFSTVYVNDADTFGVIKRTYNNETIYCAVNFSVSYSAKFDFSKYGLKCSLLDEISPNGKSSIKGTVLTVPEQGIAIIG